MHKNQRLLLHWDRYRNLVAVDQEFIPGDRYDFVGVRFHSTPDLLYMSAPRIEALNEALIMVIQVPT